MLFRSTRIVSDISSIARCLKQSLCCWDGLFDQNPFRVYAPQVCTTTAILLRTSFCIHLDRLWTVFLNALALFQHFAQGHTSMRDLCCSAFLLLGLVLGLLWLKGKPRRLGSCREGLAAPDGTAHGPELTSWTLGAWQVRGRSGPGSLLHLRKVHWSR